LVELVGGTRREIASAAIAHTDKRLHQFIWRPSATLFSATLRSGSFDRFADNFRFGPTCFARNVFDDCGRFRVQSDAD
jgi:hypothetical protein